MTEGLDEQQITPPAPTSRVLLVVDSLFGGGAEQHVLDLAQGLRERGWHVEIACSVLGCAPERLSGLGVPVHEVVGRLVKRRVSIRYAWRLRRLVTSGCYDVVHAHVYASEVAAALAVSGHAIPLVLSEHTEAPWRGPLAQRVSRLVYHRAAAIIAVSSAIAALLQREYAVDRRQIRCILPVGRREGPARQSTSRPEALPAGPLVGCVGRLQPEKGVDVLIRAFAAVRSEVPEAHLVVIGEGAERRNLERLTDELGVSKAVQFLGYRDDATEILPWLDVLTVPSRSDGSPLVIHEALEAGTAVVGSAVGGIPDRLADGAAGVLIPPDDPDRLAPAIVRLLVDREARDDLVRAGRRHAQEHTYDAMVATVAATYAGVLAPATGSAGDDFVPTGRGGR